MLEQEKSQGSMFIFQDCQTGVGEVPNRDAKMDLMRDRRIQQLSEARPPFFYFKIEVSVLKLDPLYFILRQQVCHLKLDPLCGSLRYRSMNIQGVGGLGRRLRY